MAKMRLKIRTEVEENLNLTFAGEVQIEGDEVLVEYTTINELAANMSPCVKSWEVEEDEE